MVYLSVAYICNAMLFMFLLQDRYKIIATLLSAAASVGLSYLVSSLVRIVFKSPILENNLSVLANLLLLYLASLFIYTNNPLQKLYLVFLGMSNYAFLQLFIERFLGLLPVKLSGSAAGFLSVLIYVLFTALLILCLRRVLHYFSDRNNSSFILVISAIQIIPYILCVYQFEFLFRYNPFFSRLFISFALYLFIIFAFRSIYYAAKFREDNDFVVFHNKLVHQQKDHLLSMMANIKDLSIQSKERRYTLDAISVMARSGDTDKIPAYIDSVKARGDESELLQVYCQNPYLNAILAYAARLSSTQGIAFEANVNFTETIPVSDICMIANELLAKAIDEAGRSISSVSIDSPLDEQALKQNDQSADKKKPEPSASIIAIHAPALDKSPAPQKSRIHFNLSSTPDALVFEMIYPSCVQEEQSPLSLLASKSFGDVMDYLFTERQDLSDEQLGYTETLVEKYSGKISISTADSDAVIRVIVNH